jgi:hypothetical protein
MEESSTLRAMRLCGEYPFSLRTDHMNFFFLFLSCGYIAVIFLMAGSSVVSKISAFNPDSLLHAPLYAILTFLLFFSFSPVAFRDLVLRKRLTAGDRQPLSGPGLERHHEGKKARCCAETPSTPAGADRAARWLNRPAAFVLPGLIAILIAIADEWHQTAIPTRDGSFSDVLIDLAGITLALFMIRKWLRSQIVDR